MLTNNPSNRIEVQSATRRAAVPASVFIRAFRRTQRTLAATAALAMLHSWGTAAACSAHADLERAADETLLYAGGAL